MKAKMVGILGLILFLIVGWFFSGCAERACPDPRATPEVRVELPPDFVAMQGLAGADYDDEGWPRYIMNRRDGSVMTLIPETCFVMGDSGLRPDENPRHAVRVGKYYIDLYAVNNVQYDQFARATYRRSRRREDPCRSREILIAPIRAPYTGRPCPSSGFKLTSLGDSCALNQCIQTDFDAFRKYWEPCVNDSHPVRNVNYWEAWYYCRWVGKDLPTEAEWELAAKGPEGRLYPWGNIEPDSVNLLCNYGDPPTEDGYHYTAPVSAFAAGRSPFGLYNMAGNVWEWCKDYYDATGYSAAFYSDDPALVDLERMREYNDPTGPVFGEMRVIRGGAYTSDIVECRTTSRQAAPPNYRGMNIGFRGVLRIR